MTIQYADGSVVTNSYTVEALRATLSLDAEKEIFSCTYQFEGGLCRTTASNCAAAYQGFADCACINGHPSFCPVE